MKSNNENLLPQIIEQQLNLSQDKFGTLSLTSLEVATGKTITEIGNSISERICSLPIAQAKRLWSLLDNSSKSELTFHDYGRFNLDLVDKLNIRGNELHAAFVHNLKKEMYELDFAPLSEPQYFSAVERIRCELLSVCKQLNGAANNGYQRLMEFMGSFDIELLTGFVRHEIAAYYIDERGAELEWDIAETDGGNDYQEEERENEQEPDDVTDDTETEKNELLELKHIIERGYEIPPALAFTYYVQNFIPEMYVSIRHQLVFDAKEQGLHFWERPNPLEHDENSFKAEAPQKLEINNRFENLLGRPAGKGLVLSNMEKELNRITRLFVIGHPLKKNFQKIYLQDFETQGKIVAKLIAQTGKDCSNIQTFEDIKKAVWEAVGYTAVKKWIARQDNPKRFIESSGKKQVLDEMDVLGIRVFGEDNLIAHSLEASRNHVSKLYGWFCLVKIFWNITNQNKRFLDLAVVKDDTIIWDEKITLNTVIFQSVLVTQRMFFSLQDVAAFCEAAKAPEWLETMKNALTDLALANDAYSAVPIFHERIEFLAAQSESIFYVAEHILLSSKKEREIVATIREIVKQCVDDFLASVIEGKKEEEDVKDLILLGFSLKLASHPELFDYKDYANRFMEREISKVELEEWMSEGANKSGSEDGGEIGGEDD